MSATPADGNGSGRLRLSHPALLARLPLLRRQVSRWAAAHGVPADGVIDLQLVLGEAVTNGVEHAYRDDEPGTVEVDLELRLAAEETVVEVRVVDHGNWRPIPLRKNGRGRGLAIIDQLSRGLRIATTAEGTQLTCIVPVRA